MEKKEKKSKQKTINTAVGVVIIILSLSLIELLIYGFYSYIFNRRAYSDNNKLGEVVIKDYITSKSVLDIYNLVKIENNYVGNGPSYYLDDYNFNLYDKINVVLSQSDLNTSELTENQKNYIQNNYQNENISLENYISLDNFNSSFQKIFNSRISSNEINSLNYKKYGFCPSYTFDSTIEGYLKIEDCDNNSNYKYISKVYEYKEYDNVSEVSVAIALIDIAKYNDNNIVDIYFDEGMLAIKNINLSTFNFDDNNINDFIHLKYSFKKNSVGDYYFYDIEKTD